MGHRVWILVATVLLGGAPAAQPPADEPPQQESRSTFSGASEAALGEAFLLGEGEEVVVAEQDFRVQLVAVGGHPCADAESCKAGEGPQAFVRIARASTDQTLYVGAVDRPTTRFPHFTDPVAGEPYGVTFIGADGDKVQLVIHGADRCTLFSRRADEAQCWAQVAIMTHREEYCARISELGLSPEPCMARLRVIVGVGDEDTPEATLPVDGVAEIGIERTPCLGDCPWYSLVFKSDGTFVYTGRMDVARIGTFSGTIERSRFDELARVVESVRFMSLENEYAWNVTDAPTTITTAVVDGVRKTVSNYARGGPEELEDLERRIDALLADARWAQ